MSPKLLKRSEHIICRNELVIDCPRRRLVFKRRLFLGERPLQAACAAETELLYYQALHAVRHERLPIDTDEAVRYLDDCTRPGTVQNAVRYLDDCKRACT